MFMTMIVKMETAFNLSWKINEIIIIMGRRKMKVYDIILWLVKNGVLSGKVANSSSQKLVPKSENIITILFSSLKNKYLLKKVSMTTEKPMVVNIKLPKQKQNIAI